MTGAEGGPLNVGSGGGGGAAADPVGDIEIGPSGAAFRPVVDPYSSPLFLLAAVTTAAILLRSLACSAADTRGEPFSATSSRIDRRYHGGGLIRGTGRRSTCEPYPVSVPSGTGGLRLTCTTLRAVGGTMQVQASRDPHDVSRGVRARAVQVGTVLLAEAALVFSAAGRLDWGWAWAFLVIYLASIAVNAAFLSRNPEIVAERGRPAEFKRWDKWVSGLWGVLQYIGLPLVAGLDARLSWTGSLDVAWHLAGALLFGVGLGLFGWAMITNAYFSTAARIQSDRGQTVCRSGPYRFVRHPGYSGAVLQSLGVAVLLGSVWALLPGIAAAGLMVLRTGLEDRMLQAELPGYPAYVRDVRHRLAPGIW